MRVIINLNKIVNENFKYIDDVTILPHVILSLSHKHSIVSFDPF